MRASSYWRNECVKYRTITWISRPDCIVQDRLLSITEAIETRLEYFQELEHATRMLNSPGDSLVLQTDFLYMVERVDICIDYLKGHVSSASSSHDPT